MPKKITVNLPDDLHERLVMTGVRSGQKLQGLMVEAAERLLSGVSTTPKKDVEKPEIGHLPENEIVGIITTPHEIIGTPITTRGWQAEVLEKLDELRQKDFDYAQLAAALGAVLTARNIEKLTAEFGKLAESKGQGRPGVVGGRKRSRRPTRTNKGAA